MAHRSWEVTQVNELLGQMERFKGLFVCATNLREKLDPAVFRRFDFKIKLDYLKGEQAWGLFRALAKELKVRLSSKEVRNLKQRIDYLRHLAPGDFAVIRRRAHMVEKKIDAGLLMDWLERRLSPSP